MFEPPIKSDWGSKISALQRSRAEIGREIVEKPEASPLWRSWLRRGILAVGVLTCIYTAAIVWTGGVQEIILNPAYMGELVAIVALILLNIVLRGMRFYYYQRFLGWSVAATTAFSAFIASLCFSATPGKMGELMKIVLLRTRHPVSLAEGLAIHVVERMLDVIIISCFALVGLFLFSDIKVHIVIAALLVGLSTLLITQTYPRKRVISLLGGIIRFSKFQTSLHAMNAALQVLLRPRPVMAGIALGLIAWSCEIAVLILLLDILQVQASLLTFIAVYGIAVLAGALSMLPGGIGGFELAMGVLLIQIGATEEASMAVALFRTSTLWLSSVIGLGFLLGWARSPRQSI